MLRLLAALLVAPLVVQAQPRPRKVFISVSDAHNVKGSFKEPVGIFKLLQVVSSLEAP